MPVDDAYRCREFPCTDVRHAGYTPPQIPAQRAQIRVIMVSAAPNPVADPASPLYRKETIEAIRSAGYSVSSLEDVRRLGVYVTTAVKCPKIGFGLKSDTVEACSKILEAEIDALPNVRSILLMGNTAIRAINTIAVRKFGAPAIPHGSAYKVKGHEYPFGEITLFPSYPESGRNLSVEGNRQDVIAVDIRNAIEIAGGPASRPHSTRPRREQHRTRDGSQHPAMGTGD